MIKSIEVEVDLVSFVSVVQGKSDMLLIPSPRHPIRMFDTLHLYPNNRVCEEMVVVRVVGLMNFKHGGSIWSRLTIRLM